MKLKSGYGYWETDYYPIGGCFRRAGKNGLAIEKVIRSFNNCHGSNTEGITDDGRKVCFDINYTEEPFTIDKIKMKIVDDERIKRGGCDMNYYFVERKPKDIDFPFAVVQNDGEEIRTSVANVSTEELAALYAASPELLECCKAVIDAWHAKDSNFGKIEPAYLQTIRAAIAKVEGR